MKKYLTLTQSTRSTRSRNFSVARDLMWYRGKDPVRWRKSYSHLWIVLAMMTILSNSYDTAVSLHLQPMFEHAKQIEKTSNIRKEGVNQCLVWIAWYLRLSCINIVC